MRILWITNTIFPAPSKVLGLQPPIVGGWMYGLANQIASLVGIQLAIATTYSGNGVKTYNIDGVLYYLLPLDLKTEYPKSLEPYWLNVCSSFLPDVVHIHGTEYSHGLACMRACAQLNYIVSIQGLVSVYARYFYAGISAYEIIRSITFRDILRRYTLFTAKRGFIDRGLFEKDYIQRTEHVIGRTKWDYAHTKAINQSVNYHFCNETLRDGFYISPKWDINKKTDYTIFLSHGGSPIKGLHQVLKAVYLLKKDFPYIKVRVAGHNIVNPATFLGKIKRSSYGAYLFRLVKKLNLHDQIQFTEPLTEEKMIAEYLGAHLFICPSSIENSPNSLGEAQLLGVPSIASYVGGVPDMVLHGETGLLYRFEEIEMLADHIRLIFTDPILAKELSRKGMCAAKKRHNQEANLQQIIKIYRALVK